MMAEDGHKVSLHVYDLSQGLARQLSSTFLGKAIEGIWHTGVIVYENEYYFGGGIQWSPVGRTPYGTPLHMVELGVTHIPREVFEEFLTEITPRYTAETYSLLHHNCNNFSNEITQFLIGVTIPDYILKLPDEVTSSPMGHLILPMIQQLETTLRVGAVPQAPQFIPSTTRTQTSQLSHIENGNRAKSEDISTNEHAVASSQEVKHAGDSGNNTKEVINMSPAAVLLETENTTRVAEDPLGEARSRVQEEICKEFAAIMATGKLKASEAAALATRRVMERHGRMSCATSES